MIKIIFGIIILLGLFTSSVSTYDAYIPTNSDEYFGYIVGKILVIAISLWLIYSGLSNRNKVKYDKKKSTLPKLVTFLFLNIKRYANSPRKFLLDEMVAKKPASFKFTILILGIGLIVDRAVLLVTDWLLIWIMALALGVFVGYLAYYVIGSAFHLLVLLSGGSKDIRLSRNIYLYASMPYAVALIIAKVVEGFAYGHSYFTLTINSKLHLFIFIFIIVAQLFSIYLMYFTVNELNKIKKIKGIIFLLIVPIVFFSSIYYRVASSNAGDLFVGYSKNESAIELIRDGDYMKAENSLKEAQIILQNDKRAQLDISHNLGILYSIQGETEKAIIVYKEALDLTDDDTVEYVVLLGEISLLEGNVDEAVKYFEKAISYQDDNLTAHTQLGLLFSGQTKYDFNQDMERALVHNEKAFGIGGDVATLQNLAINYFFMSKTVEAFEAFVVLVEAEPDNALANYFLGIINYHNNQQDLARVYLELAVELDPELLTEEVQIILK